MAAARPDYTPPRFNGRPMQLVQVHVFFRHGDRSPTPGNGNPELWSKRLQEMPPLMTPAQYRFQERPFCHLTEKGAEETRALGRWIREAYLGELRAPAEESHSFIRVRSTNFLRTHLSAWFVLESLLGSSEAAASVQVHMLGEQDENLYQNDHCRRLTKLWRAIWSGRRKSVVLADGSSQEAGWLSLFEAADTAQCALSHGDPLPEDFTEEKLKEIQKLLAEDCVSAFQDKEICTLTMGRLLREVVDAMKQRSGPSMYLYSTHDTTIVPLSVCLGVPWKGFPAYAASICIELWSCLEDDDSQLFVRVLYDGDEVALPVDLAGIEFTWQQPQQATSGKTLVTLDEFLTLAGWSTLTEAEFTMRCRCEDC